MINHDVLRLQVEVDPPAGQLRNLIPNPNGALGAFGWATPFEGSYVSARTTSQGFQFLTGFGSANYFYSQPAECAPGEWVSASWVCEYTYYNQYKAQINFMNAAGAVIAGGTADTGTLTPSTSIRRRMAPVQAPAGTAHVRFLLQPLNGSGASTPNANVYLWFSNVAMAKAATAAALEVEARRNLVPNPFFEHATPTTGWTTRSFTASTDVDYSGLILDVSNTSLEPALHSTGSPIPVVPRKVYTVGFSVWAEATEFGNPVRRDAKASIQWYDSAHNQLTGWKAGNEGETVDLHQHETPEVQTWEDVTVTAQAPTGAAFARARVDFATGAASVTPIFVGERFICRWTLFEDRDTVRWTYSPDMINDPWHSWSVPSTFENVTGEVEFSWTGTVDNSASIITELTPVTRTKFWTDILGPTHEIKVNREALNVGTLTATVLDANLDPATDATLRPGAGIRLTAENRRTLQHEPLFTGTVDNAHVEYDPRNQDRARIEITATDNISAIAATPMPRGVATIDELPFVIERAGVPFDVNGSGNQVPSATTVAYNENASALDQVAVARDTASGYAWVDRFNTFHAYDPDRIRTYHSGVGRFSDSPSTNAANLMPNPEFNNALDGWRFLNPDWSREIAYQGPAEFPYMKLTKTANAWPHVSMATTYDTGITIPAAPGETVHFSCAFIGIGLASTTRRLRFEMVPRDADGNALATRPTPVVVIIPQGFWNDTHLQSHISGVMPAGTASVIIDIYNDAAGALAIGEAVGLDQMYLYKSGGDENYTEFAPDAFGSYSDIDVDFDSGDLVNEVRIKWLRYDPATLQTVAVVYGPWRDEASIADWGRRSTVFTMQGALEDPAAIQAKAEAILATNANPGVRINGIQVPIKSREDVTPARALVDLYDVVEVELASRDLLNRPRVTGISHTITPTTWLVDLAFSGDGAVAPATVTPEPTSSAASLVGVWRTVGAAGEPAFGANWVADVNPVQFTKDAAGNAWVRGRAKGVVGQTPAATVFVLPVGYRPTAPVDLLLKTNADSTSASWYTVATNGNVSPAGNVAAARVQSNLGFSFPTR